MEACLPGSSQQRLFILDKKSDLKFLIDTGADISVFPEPRYFSGPKHDHELHVANRAIINTYGTTTLDIDFGLLRNYWLADLTFPILGQTPLCILFSLEMSAALRVVYYYPQALFLSFSLSQALSHSLCRTTVIMREASHEFSYLGFQISNAKF